MITDSVVNFMGQRKVAFILSIFLIIGSIVSFGTKGLVLGLDFTGGTQIEVGYQESANLIDIRAQLTKAGFEAPVVVHFGSERDVLIRMQGKPESGLSDAVLQALQTNQPNVVLRRVDFVGPQVGEELREDGGLGMLVALLVVMMYIAIRFQYKFSLGAVVALAHDVIITLGFFSVTGLEFDLTVLAAVLAVIGYSLNDTIVVSDRIRENLRLLRISNIETVINKSLTQTLGRTLVTSLTTLLVLVSLFLFGGELIHNFAIALIVGVFIGTYSSIYVASNMLLTLGLQRED
jgi:preprotein translocase subunit SecF